MHQMPTALRTSINKASTVHVYYNDGWPNLSVFCDYVMYIVPAHFTIDLLDIIEQEFVIDWTRTAVTGLHTGEIALVYKRKSYVS